MLVLTRMGQLGPRGVDLNGQRAHPDGSAARRQQRLRDNPPGIACTTKGRAKPCPSATSRDTTTNRCLTTSGLFRTASPSDRRDTTARRPVMRVILYLTFACGDRSAEIVLRLDGRGHLLTEHHRRGRSVDLHLELGLLVLLDPEPCRRMLRLGIVISQAPSIASDGSSNEPSKPPKLSAVNCLVKTLSRLGIRDLDRPKLGRRTADWSG